MNLKLSLAASIIFASSLASAQLYDVQRLLT